MEIKYSYEYKMLYFIGINVIDKIPEIYLPMTENKFDFKTIIRILSTMDIWKPNRWSTSIIYFVKFKYKSSLFSEPRNRTRRPLKVPKRSNETTNDLNNLEENFVR